MHILLPTDVFPPRSGGAGWSAHALALALQARGHRVRAIVPRRGEHGTRRDMVLGIEVLSWGYAAPRIPFVQNMFRHELAWRPLARVIQAATRDLPPGPMLIHAQHVQTCPPAVLAARRLGCPVVVTVRDHWPWDYFATGLHGGGLHYPRQSVASLATDLPARLGLLRGILAWPAIPYMLAHLHRRAAFLAAADAVIAVSPYVARRLAGHIPPGRVHVIPNMVDIDAVEAAAARPGEHVPVDPFLLFVGKLERNKGADLLPAIMAALPPEIRHQLPELLICGNGPLEPVLQRDLATLGVRARVMGWLEHDGVLQLMARCRLLLFPSAWGDTLSRTLLEASALGAPILAMPTGGTPFIITDGETGALEPTVERFARRLQGLLADDTQRAALGAAARAAARRRFATTVVINQVERLYQELVAGVAASALRLP